MLAGPKPDSAHPDIAAIKDYTVVRHNGAWQVYATTASPSQGWNLVHFSFADWPQANAATHTYLDTTPIGRGYRAAPHLFFFAPQGLWYMVYQTGVPTYSTSTDPGNPRSWTTPRNFMSSEPAIVTQNKGAGAWLDFWMICDSSNCYLFSSDDNGHIYRSQTTLANFPNGFGNTVIALQDSRFALFEGSAVYKVAGRQPIPAVAGSHRIRWPALVPLVHVERAERNLDAASGDRSEPVRALEHRHVQRHRLDTGLQSRRAHPFGQRSDGAAESLPAAVPVPGAGSERGRRLHPPAVAHGPAHAEQFHVLVR